jgi:hypothetical protein
MVKGAPLQNLSGNFMFNDKFVLELLIGGVLQLLQWLDFKFQMLCTWDMDMIENYQIK